MVIRAIERVLTVAATRLYRAIVLTGSILMLSIVSVPWERIIVGVTTWLVAMTFVMEAYFAACKEPQTQQ